MTASEGTEPTTGGYRGAACWPPVVPSVGAVPVEVPADDCWFGDDPNTVGTAAARNRVWCVQCADWTDQAVAHDVDHRRIAEGDLAGFAARVRAEERRRIAGLIRENAEVIDSFARDGSPAGLIAYLINDVLGAAGSAVPVGTPEPSCARLVPSFNEDEDVSPCGAVAVAEVFTTTGLWQPFCVMHSRDFPDDRLRELGSAPVPNPPRRTELLAAGDAVDLLRALLADEDRAVELMTAGWFESVHPRRWADCSPRVKAAHRRHFGPVLAALQKVADRA